MFSFTYAYIKIIGTYREKINSCSFKIWNCCCQILHNRNPITDLQERTKGIREIKWGRTANCVTKAEKNLNPQICGVVSILNEYPKDSAICLAQVKGEQGKEGKESFIT